MDILLYRLLGSVSYVPCQILGAQPASPRPPQNVTHANGWASIIACASLVDLFHF